ncbi:MAG: helix-turn-helix transcriptional regulator [Actinobacteria bacterium]|nr:helix-turn-helix transcriptional regulator [Actinomycetota bacterium]
MVSSDLLLEARRRSGLSQAELAQRAGKPTSSIGRWERGEVLPSLEILRNLVRACGLELTFHIANADLQDHDLTLIERSLDRTPAERVADAVGSAAAIDGLWGRVSRD